MRTFCALALSGVLLTGCVVSGDPTQARGFAALGLVDQTPEAMGIITFLNNPNTTDVVLRQGVGLSVDAATALMTWRDGPDGLCGTPDDQGFATLDDVDAVAQLTDDEIYWLLDWVAGPAANGGRGASLGTIDSVPFTVGEAELTMALVNHAHPDFLNDVCRLDRRAVTSIVEARPVASVHHLAELHWIGPKTLQLLKTSALWYVD